MTIRWFYPIFPQALQMGRSRQSWVPLGLEKPDIGDIFLPAGRVAAVFQEDRLSEPLSAVANIRLVCPAMTRTAARDLLLALGFKEEDCGKSVSTLSGGMRRRVSVLRAVLNDGSILLLDEPFKGLDSDTKQLTAEFI